MKKPLHEIEGFVFNRMKSIVISERIIYFALVAFLFFDGTVFAQATGHYVSTLRNLPAMATLFAGTAISIVSGLYHAYPPRALRLAIAECAHLPDSRGLNSLGTLLYYCNRNFVPSVRTTIRKALLVALSSATPEVVQNSGLETRQAMYWQIRHWASDIELSVAILTKCGTILDDSTIRTVRRLASQTTEGNADKTIREAAVECMESINSS